MNRRERESGLAITQLIYNVATATRFQVTRQQNHAPRDRALHIEALLGEHYI